MSTGNDLIQARARELCVADGIDPDSRPDGRAPAWLIYRDRIVQEDRAQAVKPVHVPTPSADPKPIKPLNSKAYGSIGHLPMSRLGSGDWSVNEGMSRILTETPRKGDRVIVREKLDGACMSVANIDGGTVPLSRAGYRAADAEYPHIKAFAPYVEKRAKQFSLLEPGERIVGEWMSLAHGTIYDVNHPDWAPFIVFDIFRGGKRILNDEFVYRTHKAELQTAYLIHDGPDGISIEDALSRLGTYGKHGSQDPVEGAVWRVERENKVDFLAKWVRPDKVDGKYLVEVSHSVVTEPLWLWQDAV
jgi:hypothetical protein